MGFHCVLKFQPYLPEVLANLWKQVWLDLFCCKHNYLRRWIKRIMQFYFSCFFFVNSSRFTMYHFKIVIIEIHLIKLYPKLLYTTINPMLNVYSSQHWICCFRDQRSLYSISARMRTSAGTELLKISFRYRLLLPILHSLPHSNSSHADFLLFFICRIA